MNNMRELISLVESKQPITLDALPYAKTDLKPVLSEEALNYHYGKLAKAYVDKYNSKEGDTDFMYAGAFLHNIYFSQFKSPANVKPSGKAAELINDTFKSFDKFKEALVETAMSIQGSGWVYLDTRGNIKKIHNHQVKSNIVLLVDMWEHAFNWDYEHKKETYVRNIWKIINWETISQRLT